MPVPVYIGTNITENDRELDRLYNELGQIFHRPEVRKALNQTMTPIRKIARANAPENTGALKRATRTRTSKRVKRGGRYHSEVRLTVGYEARSRNLRRSGRHGQGPLVPIRYPSMLGAEFGNVRFPRPTHSLEQAIYGRRASLVRSLQRIVEAQVRRLNTRRG